MRTHIKAYCLALTLVVATPLGAYAIDGVMDDSATQQEENVRRLTGQIEELQHRLQQTEKKLDRALRDNEMRFKEIEKQTSDDEAISPDDSTPKADKIDKAEANGTRALGSTKPATDGKTKADAAPEKLYATGLEAMKSKDYPKAQKNLLLFLKQSPTHKLAGNGLYWLGEAYYAQGMYQEAGKSFVESYKKYPNGAKAGSSLYKLGLTLFALNRKPDGCAALSELRSRFVDDQALVQQAATSAQQHGCRAK